MEKGYVKAISNNLLRVDIFVLGEFLKNDLRFNLAEIRDAKAQAPDLTWRDVQHLIVWTSEVAPVSNNPGWQKNAAGLWFNTRFGFGLMNAFALVTTASNWTRVPPKSICVIEPIPAAKNKSSYKISYGTEIVVNFKSHGCKGTSEEVNYVEHVEVETDIQYSVRGALEIYLISPAGTKVQILNPRKLDISIMGFQDWAFMSVTTWGERSEGLWTVRIMDNVGPAINKGIIERIRLKIHGSSNRPQHMPKGPRFYNHNYNLLQNGAEPSHVNNIDPESFDSSNVLDYMYAY